MANSNIVQVVADKIEKESHDANAIAERLKKEKKVLHKDKWNLLKTNYGKNK